MASEMKVLCTLILLLAMPINGFARNWDETVIDEEFLKSHEMSITSTEHIVTCKGVKFLEVFGYPKEYQGNKLKQAVFRTYKGSQVISEFYLEYDVPSIIMCASESQLLSSSLELLYIGKTKNKVLRINDFKPYIE